MYPVVSYIPAYIVVNRSDLLIIRGVFIKSESVDDLPDFFGDFFLVLKIGIVFRDDFQDIVPAVRRAFNCVAAFISAGLIPYVIALYRAVGIFRCRSSSASRSS